MAVKLELISRILATLVLCVPPRAAHAEPTSPLPPQVLVDSLTSMIPRLRSGSPDNLERFIGLLDSICSQKDCAYSRLFWFRDLDAARQVARATGRPILSLRLFGALDEDLSATDSRFFRTVLYADQTVGELLRDNFVLHWSSQAPAPVVTISFGNGREVTTTLKGRSVHYVLTPDLEVLDALPGLYTADDFETTLREWSRFYGRARNAGDSVRTEIEKHWQQLKDRLLSRWESNLITARSSGGLANAADTVPYGEDGRLDMEPPVLVPLGQEKLPAVSIAEIAVKRQIEFPESLLASNSSDTLSPSPAAAGQRWDELRKATTRSMWEKLILLNKAHGRLDAGSIALLNAKQSGNSRYAEMNASVEVNAQMLVNFARSVVMESLRNEFLLHFRVLEYLGHAPSATLEEVNSYIYRDLFQIAIDDPYLGMRLPDVYGAMDDFIDTRSAPQTLLSAR